MPKKGDMIQGDLSRAGQAQRPLCLPQRMHLGRTEAGLGANHPAPDPPRTGVMLHKWHSLGHLASTPTSTTCCLPTRALPQNACTSVVAEPSASDTSACLQPCLLAAAIMKTLTGNEICPQDSFEIKNADAPKPSTANATWEGRMGYWGQAHCSGQSQALEPPLPKPPP